MRITGTLGRAGDRRVDIRVSCRSAGPSSPIDGEVVSTTGKPSGRSEAFHGLRQREVTATIDLVAGEPHRLEVEFVPPGPSLGGLAIGVHPARARRPASSARCDAAPRRRRDLRGRHRRRLGDRRAPDRDEMVAPASAGRARARGRRGERSDGSSPVNAASPVEMSWAGDVGADFSSAGSRERSGETRWTAVFPVTSHRRASCRRRFRFASTTPPAFKSYPVRAGRCTTRRACSSVSLVRRARHRARFCFGHGLSYTSFELERTGVSDRE
jgi:hypothetical protein